MSIGHEPQAVSFELNITDPIALMEHWNDGEEPDEDDDSTPENVRDYYAGVLARALITCCVAPVRSGNVAAGTLKPGFSVDDVRDRFVNSPLPGIELIMTKPTQTQ
jgi:hypothetical protein